MVHTGSLLLCLHIPGVIGVEPNGSWVNSDQIQSPVYVYVHTHKPALSLNVWMGTLEMCLKASKFCMIKVKQRGVKRWMEWIKESFFLLT